MYIVHTEASCGWGGQETRILEESRGMLERGHQVSLLCPAQATIHSRALERGINTVALPIGHKSVASSIALRRWIVGHRPDVLNTHSSTDSWLAALACASLRRAPPIVRTRHISAPVPRNPASRWLYRSAAQRVITTGESLRASLIRDLGLPPQHVISVPTGIDTFRFAPGDRREAQQQASLAPGMRWIGILATLRSWKGHLFLIDALARLARPELRLLIIGEGPMRENIERRVREQGLGNSVLLVGEQRRPEQWLRAMDVFCLPSYANEGVPQALMQAMLTALPVITTPVGAITEAVQHEVTGLIVPPRDAAALARAIARTLDDPTLAERLGRAARDFAAAHFGFDRMCDAMEAIFRSVAARHSAH